MTTTAQLLARHAGHHLEPLDAERTRCHTCSHTLLVKHGRSVLTPEDRQQHVEQTAGRPLPCTLHVGELAHSCRCCASERKARPDNQVDVVAERQPTADVGTWAARCRAELAAAKERRAAR